MLHSNKVYDFIGIGIGPFNLSLAALTDELTAVEGLFFEQEGQFVWHPGMLIEGTDLQTPFLADLVTFADPTSPYTFINYLHKHNRLYAFYFFNRFAIPRREYSDYCSWVSKQLDNCRFSHRVTNVDHLDDGIYKVDVLNLSTNEQKKYYSKHIVIGTGSVPMIPQGLDGDWPADDIVHTSNYLCNEDELKSGKMITVIGSGQSAAEIFYHLLQDQNKKGYSITWFTRSAGIFQKEDAKLGKEFFSPEYIDYYHSLPFNKRSEALDSLNELRNGIDPETLKKIYDLLYHRSINSDDIDITIQPLTEANKIEKLDKGYNLHCRQWQEDKEFTYYTEKIVLATGYKPSIPEWLSRFSDHIIWEDDKRFSVTEDYRIAFKHDSENHIYTLTNIEHSHGASATNLGLSVLRNEKIINSIAGEDIFSIPEKTVFQQFTTQSYN
ncbi:putrescine N-hydroxylase [Cytobacillus horneckiae]|uniref:L-lysine N6-monooxygenase MbtG n=1 Tax=Cytobacillus horneckiae TaxID=549687 RepID=A0A2N0ZN56_9BACI|nr:SidA/IucD/PvdA family monooxygenase [Cytobacillus horneckiae]MBN6889104.1 SidA/IucD/PvdA family monooxygenase [Cytobacillus horneckiae]MEC1158309.1 SidA/IucD/PvdA family monooxygenase [Cytobacillus horneckiae]MED2936463.1 SidA/IucD/PvdA family monooxygenase [Cytobacillus horneckiae]PKG30950.1 ornithine monooxygenase [Cytobacillus horneckiae]